MPNRTLLIDADVIAYQASAAVENIVCWEEDSCFPVASLSDAIDSFLFRMSQIQEDLDVKDNSKVHLCFSGDIGQNFRKSIYPPYKSGRTGKSRPVALGHLRRYMMDKALYPFHQNPILEADDLLGIFLTDPSFAPDTEKIIVSIDKDMKTLPGKFFDIGHPLDGDGNLMIRESSLSDADYWFMAQALMGDTTDGYGGCPKIGPATVAKLFNGVEHDIEHLWPVVVEAYDKAGFNEEYALTMARLARILRVDDWDKDNKRVKLWNPKL